MVDPAIIDAAWNSRFWPLTCPVAAERVKHCKNRTFLYVPSSKSFTRVQGSQFAILLVPLAHEQQGVAPSAAGHGTWAEWFAYHLSKCRGVFCEFLSFGSLDPAVEIQIPGTLQQSRNNSHESMERNEMQQFLRRASVGRLVVVGVTVVAMALPGAAQQVDYSKPQAHFPNPFAPYMQRTVAAPNLTNTARIDQMMKDGKLMLSMNDAIALALENNLDIAIARYNLDIADTDLLLAKSGGATRGVNTGVVQNTPGGGVGSIGSSTSGSGAGGTSTGTGGAGSGRSGIVTSTSGVGSAISSYDPILTGTLQLERTKNLVSNLIFTGGVGSYEQNTGTANFAYQQGFHTGTNMSVTFNNSRVAGNPGSSFNPTLSPSFRFTLSQHLLQGFGFLPNRRFIITAKNNRQISDVAFRLQVITTVNQIQNIYWDLVNAYEDVKVKERSVALANKTLSDNKKQVEIGTLAPIEVVRAQSAAASGQQDLIVSQTNLELEQLLMKNAISRSLTDAHLADAEVIPTDTMEIPDKESVVPTQDLVIEAIKDRAELSESRIDLVNRDITNRAAKNALRPTLDAFAFYGAAPLRGKQVPGCTPGKCASLPIGDGCTLGH